MPSLRGVVIGDSQVKFMCRSRLPLKASVKTCTFSFAGYDAVRMAQAVTFKKFVLQLQHDVAPIVLVFKVLPRCFNPEDADAERIKKKSRLLNRKLTATLKRWPCVRILNAEHRFLNYSKEPRRALFAFDGYHVDRAQGINQLAKIIVASLVRDFGLGIQSHGRSEPGARYRVLKCSHWNTKGNKSWECSKFLRLPSHHGPRQL
ncbi:hypothetical protein MRX96_058848 [Rhipicephalus microplus]